MKLTQFVYIINSFLNAFFHTEFKGWTGLKPKSCLVCIGALHQARERTKEIYSKKS